jgi:surface protein
MKKLMIALSAMLFVTSCNNVTELPQVTTTNPVVSDTAVIVGGDVTFTGGDKNTTRGVCWSISPNPTTSDNLLIDNLMGMGVYSFNIFDSLTSDTEYYIRSFAENSVGVGFGNELIFQTAIDLNPKNASINSNGCVECDNYAVGDTFSLDGEIFVVADLTMLKDAISSTTGADLSKFCTSHIMDMSNLFQLNNSFNQDISAWDVSNVTSMVGMFSNTDFFNRNIGNWDVSNVTTMLAMFQEASQFNADISAWDVSNVTEMTSMFNQADSFNQDLSNWCVSNFNQMPQWFSLSSALTASNHPVWGTCP